MIRIAISVEGQTEEEFVYKILTPFFRKYNIEMTPIIISTSRDKCGMKHKGGCVNIDRIKNEISKLLNNFDYVTTFYDFYGFNKKPTNDINELENIIYKLFNNHRFLPYIQKYEFETLLFSNPKYYTELFGNEIITNKMINIINEVNGEIEKINNSPQTAPSKRLEKLFEEIEEVYDKVFYGEAIINDIGLDIIRQKAKRFNEWIEKITKLSL